MQKTTGGSALVCMKMRRKILIIKALRGPLCRAVNRKIVIMVGKYYKLIYIFKKKNRDKNSSQKKTSNYTSKLVQTRRLQTSQDLLSTVKQSFLGNSSFKDLYESQMLTLNRRHFRAVFQHLV